MGTINSGLVVYEKFLDVEGNPINGLICRASIVNPAYDTENEYYMNYESVVTNKTNISGLVYWEFPIGSVIHFYVRTAGISYIKKIDFSEDVLRFVKISSLEDA